MVVEDKNGSSKENDTLNTELKDNGTFKDLLEIIVRKNKIYEGFREHGSIIFQKFDSFIESFIKIESDCMVAEYLINDDFIDMKCHVRKLDEDMSKFKNLTAQVVNTQKRKSTTANCEIEGKRTKSISKFPKH